jgi:type II secretory pathway pseudopilin PulG
MTRRLPAFSLIEIALALIIVGILASLTIPLITTHHHFNQQKTTDNNRDQIVAALAAYALQYHRLPTPAPTSEGKAIENCRNPAQCVGFVPFTTLGLSEKAAKDGYGNWFTFAVHPELTKTEAQTVRGGRYFCNVSSHSLKIQNLHTAKSIIEENEDPLAFVLISHGKRGHGALTDSGDRLPSQGAEARNSQGTLNFVEGQGPDFGHQVYWISRNVFRSLHAKSPCTAESRIHIPQNQVSHVPPATQQQTQIHPSPTQQQRPSSSQSNFEGGIGFD